MVLIVGVVLMAGMFSFRLSLRQCWGFPVYIIITLTHALITDLQQKCVLSDFPTEIRWRFQCLNAPSIITDGILPRNNRISSGNHPDSIIKSSGSDLESHLIRQPSKFQWSSDPPAAMVFWSSYNQFIQSNHLGSSKSSDPPAVTLPTTLTVPTPFKEFCHWCLVIPVLCLLDH